MSTCPRCAEAYVPWSQARNNNRFATHERAAAEAAEAKAAAAEAAKTPAMATTATATLIDLDSSIHEDLRGLDDLVPEPTVKVASTRPSSNLIDDFVPVLEVPPLKAQKLAVIREADPHLPPEAQNVLLKVWEQIELLAPFPRKRGLFLDHLRRLVKSEKLD